MLCTRSPVFRALLCGPLASDPLRAAPDGIPVFQARSLHPSCFFASLQPWLRIAALAAARRVPLGRYPPQMDDVAQPILNALLRYIYTEGATT